MITEARRLPGWKILRSIPFLGPVRVAQILAIIATPWRFRTKRQAWPYVGLAVVTRSSADQEFAEGKLRRRGKGDSHSVCQQIRDVGVEGSLSPKFQSRQSAAALA